MVVCRKDPETGERIEKDGTQRQFKKKDADLDNYAFILRKNFYGLNYRLLLTHNTSEIDIISLDLWALLKKHLGHYPYHTFRDLPITLYSPYEHIVFQFDDLHAVATETSEDEAEKRARLDLSLLLDTISGGSSGDEKLDKYFKMRSTYKKQQPETIQFEDLWTVFPPGMLIYGRPFQNEDQVFVVKDNYVPWPRWEQTREGGREMLPWLLDVWSYDWKDTSFSRTLFTLPFGHFDGHSPVTSLPFYPFDLHPEHEAVGERLIKRGRDMRKICEAKGDSRLFEYKGKTILEKKGFSGMRHDDNDVGVPLTARLLGIVTDALLYA